MSSVRGRGRPARTRPRRAPAAVPRVSIRSSIALRVVEQRPRRGAHARIVEDRGVAALELPRREERRPVDPVDELARSSRRRSPGPRDTTAAAPAPTGRSARGWPGPRPGPGAPRAPGGRRARAGARRTRPGSPAANASRDAGLSSAPATPDRPRRVEHVDDRPAVARLDLHRGVRPRGRRAADQQRDREPLALHLRGDERPSPRATGVISPDTPMKSAPISRAVSRIRAAGTITPRSTTS